MGAGRPLHGIGAGQEPTTDAEFGLRVMKNGLLVTYRCSSSFCSGPLLERGGLLTGTGRPLHGIGAGQEPKMDAKFGLRVMKNGLLVTYRRSGRVFLRSAPGAGRPPHGGGAGRKPEPH